ncbi:uncharacterized protein UV8b_04390 [Ustilaginoidea virens]|uniref:DUF676 domain-containing protein n=1 Tax=Ustilaginoidea virens TaxID=1159556 RepID=A0A8E5HR71_USTVR|nr:uncharacterized protein UV8b_04390 [Ustilaginoidea virens]QUC20149.1 hypothetical protein UV8b_04390 [Ustilaginoidea virens]
MLLLHQVGSVKIGEVIRYTVTYTPSQDRILPSPEKLYVRIRNTSTIALRAAFVHGPYTLYVSAYPANFNPNEKFPNPRRYGIPHFEPMLKAGGSWECELLVPDDIRQEAGTGRHGGFGKSSDHDGESVSWIVEVASQVIFSTSAAVGFEVVVARDQKSLNLSHSLPLVGNTGQVTQPGRVSDHQQSLGAKDGHHPAQPKGVFSRAVRLKVEDTATLWNTPRLPGWDDIGARRAKQTPGADQPVESMVKTGDAETEENGRSEKDHLRKKKVHLVILTHGLHSNLGADMLYIKESIDAAAKQARIDAKARIEREKRSGTFKAAADSDASGRAENEEDKGEEEEEEEVIVRGYAGNATRTEKGIKYLGKRLSRYILSMTYPDQPYLPVGKGASEGLAGAMESDRHDQHRHEAKGAKKAHKHSTIQTDITRAQHDTDCRRYRVSSISFVGHSLGGLVQTYAVAYIQKHSPDFFTLIKPINFIALATPFLGLSNENPLYVKFALDFGLVGRTGQDLGLTWRAPTIARSGWGALVGNLGESAHKKVYGESRPESKPLLRILPTGPAHTALKQFRNRTVYSNVVNDGIVPLRTSCLLFLDWQGLDRVENARREAGLVETVVGFGWAELTGTNMFSSRSKSKAALGEQQSDSGSSTPRGASRQVPQPSEDAVQEDDRASISSVPTPLTADGDEAARGTSEGSGHSPLAGFFGLFKSADPPKPQVTTTKQRKMLRRGQTMPPSGSDTANSSATDMSDRKPSKATAGHEADGCWDKVTAPPRTTFFESAGDLLNPSLPTVDYLIDPAKRPRTIFHDRVYHPSDIPPPPMKKRPTLLRRKMSGKMSATSPQPGQSGSRSPCPTIKLEDSVGSVKDYDDTANTNPDKDHWEVVDGSNMRVEEKIARGYHRDLSWRKVLVKLEPDAHNNIIVRRMFTNAYGWPVVKHLVDAHFSDSEAARMRDDEEPSVERAFEAHRSPEGDGREVQTLDQVGVGNGADDGGSCGGKGGGDKGGGDKGGEANEAHEAMDEVPDLPNKKHDGEAASTTAHGVARLGPPDRADSMTWSDRDWADSENESDAERPPKKGGKADEHDPAGTGEQGRQKERASASSWNWAEKIVGKGVGSNWAKSPKADDAKQAAG